MEDQVVEDFLNEAMIMRKFNHPNVLSLIGVTVHDNKPSVILPLMENGNLKKFLNSHQSVSERNMHNIFLTFYVVYFLNLLQCLARCMLYHLAKLNSTPF